MKQKVLALALALTVLSWAQTATPAAPSTPQQKSTASDSAKCPCCDQTAKADAKDAPACCARHRSEASDGKDASCCGGRDAKFCMRTDKDKTASCCKDGCGKDKGAAASCAGACGKDCEKGCCSSKTANSCCRRTINS